MKISRLLIAGLLLIGFACTTDERETPNGYSYTVIRKGDGVLPEPGQFVKMNLLLEDDNDSVWSDTRINDIPMISRIRDVSFMANEEGMDEIIRMLSVGDSVMTQMPIRILYEKSMQASVPPGIDPNGKLTFYVGVDAIMDSLQVLALQEELYQREIAKMEREGLAQMAIDTVIIDDYLEANNIVVRKTESGLRYVVTQQGTGSLARVGQQVSVNYSGYLLDGNYFDSSIESVARANDIYTSGREYGPFQFQVGVGSVIQGWDEILQLMNKGMKLTVYVPSPLAYGSMRRSEEIVENSILVFDIELVNLN